MSILLHDTTRHNINRYINAPSQPLGLIGPEGAGKSYTAQYIASNLFHVPIHYIRSIDGSSEGIDAIREAQRFLSLTIPGKAPIKRALLINQIDAIGREAQNAMLKMLEEPPLDTVIIVTYANDHRVLPTIKSRLQTIQLLPLSLKDLERSYSYLDISRAYHVSNGHAGLFTALVDERPHPISQAITVARELLTLPRYQRLARVDSIIKSKTIAPAAVLDGLFRLLQASYKNALLRGNAKTIQQAANRLRYSEQALSDLNHNVQAKLVLTNLFIVL